MDKWRDIFKKGYLKMGISKKFSSIFLHHKIPKNITFFFLICVKHINSFFISLFLSIFLDYNFRILFLCYILGLKNSYMQYTNACMYYGTIKSYVSVFIFFNSTNYFVILKETDFILDLKLINRWYIFIFLEKLMTCFYDKGLILNCILKDTWQKLQSKFVYVTVFQTLVTTHHHYYYYFFSNHSRHISAVYCICFD